MATRIETYRTPKTIIATDYGARINDHGTLDLTALNKTACNGYLIPAGIAWYKLAKGSATYLYPVKKTRVQATAALGDTEVSVQENFGTIFSAGDALVSSEDVGSVTLSGTFDGSEVINFTIDGVVYPVDVSEIAAVTLDEVAAYAARVLDTKLSFDAFADSAQVWVVGDSGSALSLAAAVVGGTGVATADVAALAPVAVGTIASVDLETSVITLAAPLAAALPAGLNIGVASTETPAGFTVTEFDPAQNQGNVGLWTSFTAANEIYWDRSYPAVFPEIRLL